MSWLLAAVLVMVALVILTKYTKPKALSARKPAIRARTRTRKRKR